MSQSISLSGSQWIYGFGKNEANIGAGNKNLLGGKGANLVEMAALGLPVPTGFIITTEVCTAYYRDGQTYPSDLKSQAMKGLSAIEASVGAIFGDAKNPLLVSVRSGARVSMPGMMDTVLNLGLNDVTLQGLIAQSGDPRFAWDSYRRFIQMYADVVMGVDGHDFETILHTYKTTHHLESDTDISAEGWQDIVGQYKDLVQRAAGKPFPQDPHEQLWGAIGAVFQSWMTPRAVTYRKIHDIPEDWGTAVTVQAMVFGNMGDDCATGVAFTRDPSTGENYFYGEYLVNAQGEDVVAGIRTPQPLSRAAREKESSALPSMEETMPDVYAQLNDVRLRLESHYKDMQDIEFTVQKGTLYMLQTRTGKRSAQAALKIAIDMVAEHLITRERALLKMDATALDQLLHPTIDPKAKLHVIGHGLPASPGAASGMIAFTAEDAEERAKEGHDVILVRIETSPEDIHGMYAACGILTTRGGMTSHAAVVARGMGRPCVAGAGSIHIDMDTKTLHAGDITLRDRDMITIDGSKGDIILGHVPMVEPQVSGDFATIMGWADDIRRLGVRANAETPTDARVARKFGAEGIGLCRTEHMFFEPSRIQNVREMIFAETESDRRAALAKLLPEQRKDFIDLFEIMRGLPVTIRLLDPPLHEFLPQEPADIAAFSEASGIPMAKVHRRLSELKESNPMLGHRGCRLGIAYPEVYEMQAHAIFEAAATCDVSVEVMIPLVGMRHELTLMKAVVDQAAKDAEQRFGKTLSYTVGTMIELPRAALMAGDIAHDAAFFSFGTNDLTQTTLGISRDDAGSFLPAYVTKGILPKDPFVSIDRDGVGQLMAMACERGRATRPDLKLGICGEHGGDPDSIQFCEDIGLDYVSCSAFRVPIARLAAAQATIRKATNLSQKKPV